MAKPRDQGRARAENTPTNIPINDPGDTLLLNLAAHYREVWEAGDLVSSEAMRHREFDESLAATLDHHASALQERAWPLLAAICALPATGLAAAAAQSEAAFLYADLISALEPVDRAEVASLQMALWSIRRVLHTHANVGDILPGNHATDPFQTDPAAITARAKALGYAAAAKGVV